MDSVIDRAGLLEKFDGDKDVLLEIVKLFIDDCPKLMDDVRLAVARKDAAAVDRTAHTLRGSASNFCSIASDAALKLERMGRAGNLTGSEEAFAALEEDIARLLPALGALLAENVSA